jgi:hypothetical protein
MLQAIQLALLKSQFILSTGFQTWWLVISIIILVSMTVLAQVAYPTKYSIQVHTVSSQGSKQKNPSGHWIWQIGMMVVAVMKTLDFFLIHKEFTVVSEVWAKIGFGISLIATAAMFMVGVISEDNWDVHLIFANIAFFGYYILAHVDLFLLTGKNAHYLTSFLGKIILAVLYILFNLAFWGMVISFLIEEKGWDNIFSRFFCFPLWEWLYFVSVIVWSMVIARAAFLV